MTDETPLPSAWSARSVLTVAVLVGVAFGAGFLWQYVEAREARQERDALRAEIVFHELQTRLAAAVIQVGHGSHEGARQLMSRFFTGLQSNLESAPAESRQEMERILARRDAVITALSRTDPSSREMLTRIFTRFQVALGGPELGLPIPQPGAPDSVPVVDTGTATGPEMPGDTASPPPGS